MRKRAGRIAAALAVATLVGGAGALPAQGAGPANLGGFTGAAESHAVKINIGDTELLVGGGESRASYERISNSPPKIKDSKASAKARGLVIPGLADAQATCSPPKLSDKLTAIATPESLKPLLDLQIGLASCALAVKDLPTANHGAGEVVADVNLTQTVVNSVPQVNEFLDTLQGQLAPLPAEVRGQANSAIDAIQQQLSSRPVVEVRVAPNRGSVTSTKTGIASASPGSAVTIDILGGIVQIRIAVAETAASVLDERPAASAHVSFVHIKALNILTPDPNDALIDQKISAPQDLTVLAGTPLETRIATERGKASTTCEGTNKAFDVCATGVADAVALSLLADPLPNIGVELVHTQVLAAGNLTSVKPSGPVLPKTGAGTAGAVLGGVALAAGGFGLRRRLSR